MYARPLNALLAKRLGGPRRFIQAVLGPWQVGKTTSIRQVLDALGDPSHRATADTATRLKESIVPATIPEPAPPRGARSPDCSSTQTPVG